MGDARPRTLGQIGEGQPMSRAPRDYQAEYQRRLADGWQRDYRAIYARRNELARRAGFKDYNEQRRARREEQS